MGVLVNPFIYGSGSNFVTTLYNGTGALRDIVTRQDLASGGLVWVKGRTTDLDNILCDTERGANNFLVSNTSAAQGSAGTVTAFNSNGFSLGTSSVVNNSGTDFVAWSFLQKAGFMDIVTVSATGGSSQTESHNLAAPVGLMIAKKSSNAGSWYVYHKDLNGGTNPENYWMRLEQTDGESATSIVWNNTAPTTTQFTLGSELISGVGTDVIVYLFAHNPSQGIACDSVTSDSDDDFTDITGLGFKPRLIMIKTTSVSDDWRMYYSSDGSDTIDRLLYANGSNAEINGSFGTFTGDGVSGLFLPNNNEHHIYMAVR